MTKEAARRTNEEPQAPDGGMVPIAGGSFLMGSEDFYPEERPVRRVRVAPFEIDRHPVTNADFARFVAATGHVTAAERPPPAEDYRGVDPALLVPGSLVFRPPRGPVPLHDPSLWWAYVPQACWYRPEGPGSGIDGRMDHPVVQVAHADAAAFAVWAGKALPSEAEWEYAARGGLDGAAYAWGDAFAPGGRLLANTWQGEFPWRNLAADGFEGTSPVGAFPPNGYGLFDMIGNVWEWTCDDARPSAAEPASACCQGPGCGGARRPKVVKGGSHLCAPNHCRRYRPAARQPQEADTSTSHIGFRCVRRPDVDHADGGSDASATGGSDREPTRRTHARDRRVSHPGSRDLSGQAR